MRHTHQTPGHLASLFEVYEESPRNREINSLQGQQEVNFYQKILKHDQQHLISISKFDPYNPEQTPGLYADNQTDRNFQRQQNKINLKNTIFRRQASQLFGNSETDLSNSVSRDLISRDTGQGQKYTLKSIVKSNQLRVSDKSLYFQNKLDSSIINNEIHQILSPQSATSRDELLNGNSQNIKVPSNFYNTLKVVCLARKFLTKISEKRRRKLFFSERHFQCLGDKASEKIPSLADLYVQKSSRTLSSIRKIKICTIITQNLSLITLGLSSTIKKIITKIPLIQPEAKGKIIWDLILALVIVYFFILIPIEIFFNNQILFQQNALLSVVFILFLMIDYVVKMNTIYYEFGYAIKDRTMIFNKYLKTDLICDGLSILVLIISGLNTYMNSNQDRALNIILLLYFSQYHCFSKILSNLEESLNLSKIQQSFLNLIKLISTLLMFEHFFSCIWYFIADYKYKIVFNKRQSQNLSNWMVVRDIIDKSWQIQYLESFYFTTVTMTTVGFGDIVPQNSLEQIVCIVFMLAAGVQMSFVLNTTGEIINSWSLQDNQVKKKIRIINNYMYSKRVSSTLKYQIRQYLKIYWQQEVQEVNKEEQQIIDNLSEDLKKKLLFESNNSFIKQSPIQDDNFSKVIIDNLLKQIKSFVITPEHALNSELPFVNEPALCRIEQGQLFFYGSPINKVPLETLNPNDYFGFTEFITGQKPLTQYFTQGFLKLNYLTRSDFLKVLKESPQDYEEFCILKDQQLFASTNLEKKCVSCLSKGHDIENCSLLHFIADKERVIKSHQFVQMQPRRNKELNERRGKSQFSALSDQWAINELAQLHQVKDFKLKTFYELQNQAYKRQTDTFHFTQETKELQITIASPSPMKQQYNKSTSQRQSNFKRCSQNQKSKLCLKQIFSKIVRKIIELNKIRPLYTQYLNLNLVVAEQDRVQAFNNNLYTDLIAVDLNESMSLLNLQDSEQLQILIMKIKLLPFVQEKVKIRLDQEDKENFESQKEFQFYYPLNNLSNLQSEQRRKLIKQRSGFSKRSLLTYMFFPHIYEQKYLISIDKKPLLNQVQSVRDANMILEQFKQTKVRRNQRRFTQMNNYSLRVSQNKVIPSEEQY